MDEGSDYTQCSEDDDEYDETNTDDVDCETTFHYNARGQTGGRLCRRNVATRSDGGNGMDNSFRNSSRSKWKKYQYQMVPRAIPIQEEDEETAGPSSNSNDQNMDYLDQSPTTNTNLQNNPNPDTSYNRKATTNLVINSEHSKHIVIHVNEFCDDNESSGTAADICDDDKLSDDDVIHFDKNSITKIHLVHDTYDNNSTAVSTV